MNNKKKTIASVIGFVTAISLLGGYLVTGEQSGAAGVHATQPMVGVIEGSEVDLAFKMAGSIKDLQVKEGEFVKEGQLLATLTNEELLAKREQALASYKLAQAKLDQAKKGVSVTDNSSSAQVEQAQAAVLAAKAQYEANKNGARPEEIAQLKSKLTATASGKDIALKNLQRMQQLLTEGAIPAAKLEEAQAQYDKAVAEHEATVEQLHMAESGARQEQIDATRAQLEQANAAYKNAVAGRGQVGLRQSDVQSAEAGVQQAKGALDEIEAYINNTKLTAPVSGIVKSVSVQKGELVAQGSNVVTIQQQDDQFVKFYVDETQLGKLAVNQTVKLFVPALQKEIDGTIQIIAPAADFAVKKATTELSDRDVRAFMVKVKVAGDTLRPGFSVEWSIKGDGASE
ncbi:HlyD family secretion protein [Brevibacillus dissolubilis]|uniref:HlyD family secretion protein n=1 Tax=Brevibacillus dissolubilis TaxID=1844116 RepID=UPI001115CBC6|nr:HlyD family efflux transporter periplasmic adaptor subunit [Brevibacillus dissolubilis]